MMDDGSNEMNHSERPRTRKRRAPPPRRRRSIGPLTVTAAVLIAGCCSSAPWSSSSAPPSAPWSSAAFVLSHPLPSRRDAAAAAPSGPRSSAAAAASRGAPWAGVGRGQRRPPPNNNGPSPSIEARQKYQYDASPRSSTFALRALFGFGRGGGGGGGGARRTTKSPPPKNQGGDKLITTTKPAAASSAVDPDECSLLLAAGSPDADDLDDVAVAAAVDADAASAVGAAEICFDPQSFDRGLDPCNPAEGPEGCVPDSAIEEARAQIEIREHSRDDDEEYDDDEEEEEEVCVLVYDVPATPSFELPALEQSGGGEGDEVDHDASELAAEGISLETGDDVDDGDNDDDALREHDDDDDDDDDPHSSPLCNRGLVIVDNFSPYHGNYLSRMAREAYGAGVVSALSKYVTGYLFQERGMTDHLSARLPDLDNIDDVERWASEIPFEVVAVFCESDSGLDDAERLGEALGLYPDRHDGFNVARRDKFLMNEACEREGLRTVRQRMCRTLEEALEFARELGVGTGESESDEEKEEELHLENNGNDFSTTAEQPLVNGKTIDDGEDNFRSNELLDEVDVPPNHLHVANGHGANDEEQEDHNGDKDEEHYTMPSNTGVLGLATNDHSLSSRGGRYCVVKPSRGVASDDVHLCPDLDSVEDAFAKIHRSTVFGSIHGQKHEGVLVQEFAAGTEYAVDIVSKAGHHKVAALWRYDKRPANGAPFVYHATEIVDADTEVGRAICEYAMSSLDALNVHWGLSHTEVIVDEEGPRLVEVNCRQHNTDFAPLTSACVGYNALDMLLAAYLGDAEEFPPNTEHKRLVWDDLPDLPVTRAYGAIVHLVSHSEGILRGLNVPALEEMEGMSSVLAMEVYPQFTAIGERIEKTVDIRTDSGWLHIMNDDKDQFLADYDRILDLMPHTFVVEGGDDEEERRLKEELDSGSIGEELVHTADIDE